MPRMNIKTTVRRPVVLTARFESRFVNCVWTVFDRYNFGHGPALRSFKDADRTARSLNEGRLQWAA